MNGQGREVLGQFGHHVRDDGCGVCVQGHDQIGLANHDRIERRMGVHVLNLFVKQAVSIVFSGEQMSCNSSVVAIPVRRAPTSSPRSLPMEAS